jgi:nitrate reductase gamma subunit
MYDLNIFLLIGEFTLLIGVLFVLFRHVFFFKKPLKFYA